MKIKNGLVEKKQNQKKTRKETKEITEFPEPMKGSVFYNDREVYACLAFHPIVEGHTIVIWKKNIKDLNDLKEDDYLYLMKIVYEVRRVLLDAYRTTKVYVVYLDEACHVHFHLFPRKEGGETGFGLMARPHGELTDLSMVPILQSLLKRK